MKVVADANLASATAQFSALGEVVLVAGRELQPEDLRDADLLLVRSVTRVDEPLLRHSRVRFVGSATSGTNHVDQEYLQARGIGFAYAPGANANSVVEYVISVICSCGSRLEQLLRGQRVGIIGYGRIGRMLEQRLRCLGISSCVYDPWLEREQYPALTDWPEVLACPVLSLHAELTDSRPWPSRHLLGYDDLIQLPGDSLLINTGRGALIDNQALLQVLNQRPDLQVALDVWEFEPQLDAELLARCVIATPHIAGYSEDGKLLATSMLYRAAARFLGLEAAPQPQVSGVTPLTHGSKEQGASVSQPLVSGTAPLQLPTGLKGAALIRWLQRQSYDVMVDDRAMREQGAENFDELRTKYLRRRELGSFVIDNAEELDQECLGIALGMGCRLPAAG